MAHMRPLDRTELKRYEPLFQLLEGVMGFVPRSLLTMGRRPELLEAFARLALTIQATDAIDRTLTALVAHVASTASGCRYCQVHTAATGIRQGIPAAKMAAAWEFETSPLFSEAERAALRLAHDAAVVPNATTSANFDGLRAHFNDRQIVDLVAVVSLFGFLNRWNDTMATQLEPEPLAVAQHVVGERGWTLGKHE